MKAKSYKLVLLITLLVLIELSNQLVIKKRQRDLSERSLVKREDEGEAEPDSPLSEDENIDDTKDTTNSNQESENNGTFENEVVESDNQENEVILDENENNGNNNTIWEEITDESTKEPGEQIKTEEAVIEKLVSEEPKSENNNNNEQNKETDTEETATSNLPDTTVESTSSTESEDLNTTTELLNEETTTEDSVVAEEATDKEDTTVSTSEESTTKEETNEDTQSESVEESTEAVETTSLPESTISVNDIDNDHSNEDFDKNGQNAEAEENTKNNPSTTAILKTVRQDTTATHVEITSTRTTTSTSSTSKATATTTVPFLLQSSRSNVYFRQKSLIFHLNDTINDEAYINKHCPSLTCEFGFRTDLNGKPLCDCFNPCYEKKCGSKVCVIQQNSEMDYEPHCYDPVNLERPPKCYMPLVPGNCRDYTSRYFYNPFKKECVHFIYTGCNGNSNNFPDWETCQMECNTCSLPPLKGPCHAKILRYFYDPAKRSCSGFEWGGCKGNENNFASRIHCEESCIDRKKGSLFLNGMKKTYISDYHRKSSNMKKIS
jgi:hypothetical protein